MKAVIIFIVLIMVGVGSSCKKKSYPESTEDNTYIYYFNARINNQDVSISAGKDDYYMYSSIQQDENKVYNFLANLRKSNCDNCSNSSIRIQINDFKVSSPGASVIADSAFKLGNYALAMNPAESYSVNFKYLYNKTASSWYWDFGDGTTSSLNNASHTYTQSGTYNVCLRITGTGGCVSTICNLQKIGPDTTLLKSQVTATSAGAKAIQFNQQTLGGTLPYRYEWDFGDGSVKSNSANPLHTYPRVGSYPVTLVVRDANNNTSQTNYNAITQGDLSSCAAGYAVQSIKTINSQQFFYDFSKIVVTWTDANGVAYTSNNTQQPATSNFSILSVEDYEQNEKGEKTKKLRVKFNCTVFNGSKSMSIDNAEAVISVAYK